MNGGIDTWPTYVGVFFVIGLTVTVVAAQFVIIYTLDRYIVMPLLRRRQARRSA